MHLRSMASISGFAFFWLMSACPADQGGLGGDSSGSSGGSGMMTSPSDPGATSVVSGNNSSTGGTTGVDPDSSGGMDSVGFITAGTTDDGPGDPQPNGSMCNGEAECESGYCLTLEGPAGGLGGVCSECVMDSDCEMGTCDFSIDVGYAICTDGSAGVDCDSDRGCADGLLCVPVFGDAGFSPTRCSECSPEVPCPMGQGCTLNLDNGIFDAYLGCVDEGTVPLGEGCPVVDGVGDGTICVSGECGVISILMGAVEIGVCSECDADEDCPMGQSCGDPGFAMGMLSPGVCS